MYTQTEINNINAFYKGVKDQVYELNDGTYYIGNSKRQLEKYEHHVPIIIGSTISKFISGEPLGSLRVVMVQKERVVYYDISNENNIGRLVGITHQAVSRKDAFINVVTGGTVVENGWGLITNKIYYAGLNGMITDIIPTGPSIVQRIGIAMSPSTLRLEFSEPIYII